MRAMESNVESISLLPEMSLDISFLTKYRGEGKCGYVMYHHYSDDSMLSFYHLSPGRGLDNNNRFMEEMWNWGSRMVNWETTDENVTWVSFNPHTPQLTEYKQ